jgi:hypothetical protein
MKKVLEIVKKHGRNKAPREMCKAGIVVSRAQARRYISFLTEEDLK